MTFYSTKKQHFVTEHIYRRDTHTIKTPEKLSSCEALPTEVTIGKIFYH
ncbi:MAG: hypothetical protein SWX82_17955 [Cyanobacteriota bacterium]|nr:hypothetical protein [Cyanobacteriota bacterium]